MNWVYLSPHLDDVALSCGGLVWEKVQAGDRVSIWTICAGNPPPGDHSAFAESLHTRWQTGLQAIPRRRAEDLHSCQVLGATPRHFALADCIYRQDGFTGAPLYTSEEALFGEVHPAETGLVHSLRLQLADLLNGEDNLVSPLAIGGHVDHRLVRAAAESLQRLLWYYADYPYVAQTEPSTALSGLGMQVVNFPVSEPGLAAWVEAVAAHESQISTFWPDKAGMKVAIESYYQQIAGVRLYLYK